MTHYYNVQGFNADTEAATVGNIGGPLVLLPGIAETVLEKCEEPDILARLIKRDESSNWNIDENMRISIFYPGNSYQTTVAEVAAKENGEEVVDYYQIPYSEIVPRMKAIMKGQENSDSRWFLAQTNNVQLEKWLDESGVMKMSDEAVSLLEKKYENLRNKYDGFVEQREE